MLYSRWLVLPSKKV